MRRETFEREAAMKAEQLAYEQRTKEQLMEKNFSNLQNLMVQSEEEQRKTNDKVLESELAIQDKRNEGLKEQQEIIQASESKRHKEKMKTVSEGLVTSFQMVGSGVHSFFTNFYRTPAYLFTIAMIFGSYHFTKFAARVAMARFGRPSLVRETSKISTNNPLKLPYLFTKRAIHRR